MSESFGRDSWNKHKWKRETSWWDDLEVDRAELKASGEDVFEWLESVAPDPYEHDFVLYTDGSGCSNGWGGYAAVIEEVDLKGDHRAVIDSDVLVSGTYGSTVQRSEFNALIDGVYHILRKRCERIQDEAVDEEEKYRLSTEGVLNQLTGPNRITILWYTDRRNLAESFLFDEEGDPLCSRSKERDMWMRWSFLTRHVCITPMHRRRNVVDGQAVCDELAGIARQAMLEAGDRLSAAAEKVQPTEKWTKPITQRAPF